MKGCNALLLVVAAYGYMAYPWLLVIPAILLLPVLLLCVASVAEKCIKARCSAATQSSADTGINARPHRVGQ